MSNQNPADPAPGPSSTRTGRTTRSRQPVGDKTSQPQATQPNRPPAASGVAPAAASNATQPAIPPEALAAPAPRPNPAAPAPAPVAAAFGTPAANAPAAAAPAGARKGTTRQGLVPKTSRQRRITGQHGEVTGGARKAAPMSNTNKMLIGGLGVAIVVVLALFASILLSPKPTTGPANTTGTPAVTANGTPTGPNTTPSGATTDPATGAATPTPPAEPLTDRQKLVADYDAFAKEHPADFQGRRERLDTLLTVYEDADWTDCIEVRLDRLKQYAARVAEERVSTAILKSNTCAQSGDFAGAFAALDSFPDSLSKTDAAFQLNFQRKKIGEMVEAAVKKAEVTAKTRCDAGQFDEALKAYDPLLASKYPPAMQDVRIRINEIKDIKKRGLKPGEDPPPEFSGIRRFYIADVYAGVEDAVDTFDLECGAAVHGMTIDVTGLQERLKDYPRSAVLYYCLCMVQARDGDRIKAEWALAQARRLCMSNPRFESRALSAEARIRMTMLQLEDAKDKAVAALKEDRENADALFVLGQLQYIEYAQMRGRVGGMEAAKSIADDMVKNFKAAVALDPAYARVLAPRLRGVGNLDTNDAGEEEAEDPYKYKGDGGNPYLASIVAIYRDSEMGMSLGTGFVIKSAEGKAWLITNHHVVGEATKFRVKYRVSTLDSVVMKETTEAKVLIKDEALDLAVMEITTVNTIPALAFHGTLTGLQCPQKVTVLGHPQGLEFTVLIAQLSNLNRVENKQRYLQIDGSIDHGMSGGPVVDQDGKVIAVVMAGYEGAKGQALGILSEHVRDICKKVKIEVELK